MISISIFAAIDWQSYELDNILREFSLYLSILAINKIYLFRAQTQQMSTKEQQAIHHLANLEDDDSDFHFQPYSSTAFAKPHRDKPTKRPQTVNIKKNRVHSTESSFRKDNQREQLKKQLKVLEENNYEGTPRTNRRVATSQSLFSMQPLVSRYNGFPAHPAKKQTAEKYSNLRNIPAKENMVPYYCISPEEQVRNDIMKKFKLRESMRENQKMAKISNFLKMANTPSIRREVAPILFLNDAKFKRTLANLLS